MGKYAIHVHECIDVTTLSTADSSHTTQSYTPAKVGGVWVGIDLTMYFCSILVTLRL